jgi:enamine deaminase RidA (YjgF/YER057c/UK114 family)
MAKKIMSVDNNTLAFGASCCALGAAAALFLSKRGDIQRWGVTPRAAAAVSHSGVLYLSGQVGWIGKPGGEIASTVEEQTRQTLKNVDRLLKQAGTSKKNVLSTQIWLKDISTDFAGMNSVWNEWVDGNEKGVRACVESKMARDCLLVEISIVAAL